MANYTNHAQHATFDPSIPQVSGQTEIVVNDPTVSIISEVDEPEVNDRVDDVAIGTTNAVAPSNTFTLLSRLGKAVKAYRVSHGYTSENLATVLNDAVGKKVFSTTQAKRLENGKLPVTIEQLVAISALLGGESIVSAKLDEILEATVKNLLAGVSLTADNIDLFV